MLTPAAQPRTHHPVDTLSSDPAPVDLETLLAEIHGLGRTIIEPASHDVDRHARFPHEAFAALKSRQLLSAYVPVEFGGLGLDIGAIARLCEALGQYCGSTAMIYAMHQIQVACIVHHARTSFYFRAYLR